MNPDSRVRRCCSSHDAVRYAASGPLFSIVDAQQVLPLAKFASKSHALRDLEARDDAPLDLLAGFPSSFARSAARASRRNLRRALNALLLKGAPSRPGKTSADPAKLTPPPRRSRTPLTLSRKANHPPSESDNSLVRGRSRKRAAFDLEAGSDSHPVSRTSLSTVKSARSWYWQPVKRARLPGDNSDVQSSSSRRSRSSWPSWEEVW
jgi:hypothetical protein